MHRTMIFLLTAVLAAGLAATAGAEPSAATAGRPITVAEAVDVTLHHDPAIRLARERVEERRGALQAESGLFDRRVTVDGTFTFDARELIGPRLEQEENRRLRLDVISRALDVTATGISQGVQGEEGGSLLFQLDCAPDQDRIVITDPNGQRIILCRNFDGEVVDVILGGGQLSDAGQLLRLVDNLDLLDGLREDARDDLEAFFLDQLRIIARILRQVASILRLQLERIGPTPDEIQNLELDVLLAHQFRFRNGASFTASLMLSSTEENFGDKPLDPAFGDSAVPNTFTSAAGFGLNLPLGKGRGRVAAAAPERAASMSLEAAEDLLAHTAAERALATVTSYWRLAAAQQRLAWLTHSEEVQGEILEKTRELVEADELTRSELTRIEGRHAQVAADVAAARQAVVTARLELAAVMGVSARRLDHAPVAAGGLPEGASTLDPPEVWVREAYARRHDLRAAAKTTLASEVLAGAAKANLRHRVDLSLNLAYNVLYETYDERFYEPQGFLDAWDGKIAGPSYGLALNWAIPFGNNRARGRLLQAQGSRDRSAVTEVDLKRTIRLRILQLHGVLGEARQELADLREALAQQERSLASSLDLFRAGELTLIDTLLTEEQLTGARLAEVDAERRIAELEAQLRFESGRLLEGDDGDPGELQLALVGGGS